MAKYIVLILALWSSIADATEDRQSKLMALVQNGLGLSSLSADRGTFGPNNEQYIASIKAPSNEDDSVRLVLISDTGTAPVSIIQSQPWKAGISDGWNLQFKRGTLLLTADGGSCGTVCHSVTTYKFRYRDHEYRLIGVDESTVMSDLQVEGDHVDKMFLITTTMSINLQTKRVRHTKERCLSADDNPWDCTPKKRTVTKEFSFTSDSRWLLEDFSPEAFSEFEAKTKYLRGYIDADFNYRERDP